MPFTLIREKNNIPVVSLKEFRRKFLTYILLTWIVPAIFGMAFLLYIDMFTLEQLWLIQTKPLEPFFVTVTVCFTFWHFRRFMQPICAYLEDPDSNDPKLALECMRVFPTHYWGLFLLYLLLAPVVVIISSEMYTDFIAQPGDWFRINLVALIVSIIVGLPIFFLILDLFGRTLNGIKINRPHVTLKAKVFLIGALIPLLIDTMLVQYYWTRTGYFTSETFVVWLVLEMLAIAGSLISVHSISQSLSPLQSLIGTKPISSLHSLSEFEPRSTDELGVLAVDYRELLEELRIQQQILEMNNQLLRDTGRKTNIAEVSDLIINLCGQAIKSDMVFLVLLDESKQELVGVAQTGDRYKEDGHFRIPLTETSMAVMVFNVDDTVVIDDVPNDPRCNPTMVARFNVLSALAVPLRVEGKRIGVLISINQVKQHSYTRREVMLLEELAREAAIAIHTQHLTVARQQTSEALQQTESMLQLVLDTIPTRVFWKDRDSVYLGCNQLFAKDAGLNEAGEIVGKTDYSLVWKDQAALYRSDDKEVMQSGEPKLYYEEPQTSPSGQLIWLETSKTPLTDGKGNILGILGTYNDVTERKVNEEELLKHRERLEELVRERTNELTAVNEELESFSYSVSHDLRAPLRSIDGFSQAVLEDYAEQLDGAGKDYLQRIRQNTQHMGKLIDDILELSRVASRELKRERIDISEIARDISDALRQAEPERAVEFRILSPLMVEADPQLTMIVLDNLIRNAWKYSSKNASTLIEIGSTSARGRMAFFVRDNGVGFDMQFADKVFSAFQRLHAKSEYEGDGVGLATVQRIIHRHGGEVWVDAEPNKSATFYFTFGHS